MITACSIAAIVLLAADTVAPVVFGLAASAAQGLFRHVLAA